MPVITLADGSKRQYSSAISVLDIVKDINIELAKSCIGACINGQLINLNYIINDDIKLLIIMNTETQGLNIIRYSCLFILGCAIKELWPHAKIATNMIIHDGFYYDIDLPYHLTLKDLIKLEQLMHKIINHKDKIIEKYVSCQEAENIFLSKNEDYKVLILKNNIDYNKTKEIKLFIYKQFIDLWDGRHFIDKNFCKYFKLQNISGAYWYGNINNKMLQRIHGTAWGNEKQLINYLLSLQEINKRDHRKIGQQLNLYHIQEEVSGMVYWHNNGWIIFRELEKFIRDKLNEYLYEEVKTPLMMNRILWEKTGHWKYYKDNMFTTFSENKEYCIKPMNCPGHIQIFNQKLKSYRDLPLRMAEFGSCHRNEPSGSLYGLMRMREFTQDDAHIFCTRDQLLDEVKNCIKMIYDVYSTFGFKKITIKLSTRPDKRIGTDIEWDYAEKILSQALENIKFDYQPSEGAFYGPKIEFTLYDCLNRAWQCGTVQLDFSLPNLLGAKYIDKNNKRQTPVMIHRAIVGSIERFIGILTEQYSGFFPIWLAPIQIVVMNINKEQINFVKTIVVKLRNFGIRIKLDLRNEKISFKIREHTLNHIPYILVCGNIELMLNQVSVRNCYGKNLGRYDITKFIEKIMNKINNRSLYQLEE